jgi:hypothetical protein
MNTDLQTIFLTCIHMHQSVLEMKEHVMDINTDMIYMMLNNMHHEDSFDIYLKELDETSYALNKYDDLNTTLDSIVLSM